MEVLGLKLLLLIVLYCIEPGESSSFVYPFELSLVLEDVNSTTSYPIKLMWDLAYGQKCVNFAIEFASSIPPFYWFAFGFSPHGDWPKTDLCIYLPQIHYYTDTNILMNGAVVTDRQQDCLHFSEELLPDGRLVLRFERFFDTHDYEGDYIIEEGTTNLAFAISQSLYMNINGGQVYKRIIPNRVIRSMIPPTQLPANVKQMIIRNGPVSVPNKETTYWCTVVRLPKLNTKHHIIKYEAVIEQGHEHLVHHMEVYHCENRRMTMPHYSGECDWKNMPIQVKNCRKVIAAWAMGADAFIYPEDAGIAIGGLGYFPFVLIETHYNNPRHVQGMQDNSGIRFWFTPNLRQYDAAILEVGLIYNDNMAIPPALNEFDLIGYCTPQCTDTGISNTGITLFASQLHAHNTGRKLKTVLTRNGIVEGIVNIDNHYSPHWQEIRHIPHIRVLPGDSLITTCTYDSSKRVNVTLGGLGINDEMCVNYIHYYPKVQLEVCKSSINKQSLNTFFNYLSTKQELNSPVSTEHGENYRKVEWTLDRIEELRTLYDSAPITVECLNHKGKPFYGEWNQLDIPKTYA